jgi:hypothetical protein
MPFSRWLTYALICISFSMLQAHADVLKYPDQDPEVAQLGNTPPRGMTKNEVRARYGEPLKQGPTVGKPPISSWGYADYTVYFEYDRVLHAVVRQENLKNNEIK